MRFTVANSDEAQKVAAYYALAQNKSIAPSGNAATSAPSAPITSAQGQAPAQQGQNQAQTGPMAYSEILTTNNLETISSFTCFLIIGKSHV